ncbi:hypothetical protein AZE42_09200 [Rhizopogon vesiculosus]|uniref:Protein kinase domain-containing protein n=1 Tax=Rhizopogon vesiculosus TaxID=180088 RepID=A0A1J8R1Y5_9AGAM|nr:hypothetical protein AZE42_09200 [Rhizopogon vesiculosus]
MVKVTGFLSATFIRTASGKRQARARAALPEELSLPTLRLEMNDTIAQNDLTSLISRPTGVHASGTYAEVHQYELKDSGKSTKLIAAKSYKPTSYEKIRSEIALLSGLSHHNVVPFLGFKDDRGSISLVMSWMSGGTLTSFIRTHGEALETPDKSTLLHDIASGLQHRTKVHSNFIVHGNLESDNILINEQHRACLSGFRQSVKLSSMEAECLRSQMPRKPAIQFAGPEWFAGRNDTRSQSLPKSLFKSDIYSLGCVIFYIFTKCMPWGDDASSTDISDKLRQDITPPRPKSSVIDDKQWDLIAPCLSHVPQRRPQDLLKRIQEYLVHVGPCDLSDQITLQHNFATNYGGYGDVYEGIWNRKTGGKVKVAVKFMRARNMASEALANNLKRELAAWRRLHHPNIVPLLGTSNFRDIKAMVSLWMENGSLEKYMRENGELPSSQRLHWAKDIAGGLKHLHEFPIIHGDLTPLNVLIDNERRAVLTDFGLSVILGGFANLSCTYTEGKPGTAAWAAPELFIDDASLSDESKDVQSPSPSKESDVYSFACLMYLIFSGRHPWVVRREADLANVIFRVRKGDRPSNTDIEARYWGLIVQCWAPAPNSRPTISKVLQQLQ